MIGKTTTGTWRVRVKSKGQVVADRTFDRKADAERWEADQKRLLALGDFVPPARGKVSLGDVAEQWMTARAHSVASSTLREEGYSIRAHVPPTLRNRPVGSIRSADLEALYGELLGKLSRSTVSRFRNTLSSLFGWAVRQQIIAKNPVLASRVPRGSGTDDKAEIFPFTLDGLRALHTVLQAENAQQADIALVLGLTGLRWGELVALRARDIQQLPYPAIRVSRSAPDGEPIRTVTKGGSARTVPLAADLLPIIQSRLEGKRPDDLLFTNSANARLNGPNWKRSVKWAGHSDGRRVHDLRHTAATLWLSSGVDVKTVQHWLGHSTMTLTVDTYAHWLGTDADVAAIARINAILGDATGTPTPNLRRLKGSTSA